MPYNPGVTDRSGELLGAGMERGAGALMEGFMRQQEGRKRTLQTSKHVDALMKLNPELLQRLGMAPEEFSMKSAEERIGLGMGAVAGMTQQMEMSEMEDRRQHHQAGRAREEYLLQQERDRSGKLQRFGKAIDSYEATPEMIRRPRREVMESEVMRLHPDDARGYSAALENIGRDFAPAEARQIFGTDYYLQQVGRDSYTAVPGRGAKSQRPEKVLAPAGAQSSWIYSEDMEEFKKRLLEIEQPEVRDAVLEARRNFNLSSGKGESELATLLKGLGGGKEEPKEKKDAGGLFERFKKWKN